MTRPEPHLEVTGLTLTYGARVIQRDLTFSVPRGKVFLIMGGSGCGKSTLLRSLVGLVRPAEGRVSFDGTSLWDAEPDERDRLLRRFGVLYQGGALWSSMTLAENVALPLRRYTRLDPARIRELAAYKLSLVGLGGFDGYYPSEISGGMKKRAGLARAMALDPEVLFFDEPSAGLDPVSSRLLDDLILDLRASLGTTIVVVTHELASIFAIGDDCVFLDPEAKTLIASGSPKRLLTQSEDPKVRAFLTRGDASPGRCRACGGGFDP